MDTANGKKLLFLIFHEMDEGNGVSNKIASQIKAFRHHGFHVDFSYLVKENGFLTQRYYNHTLIDVARKQYHAQKYGYKYRYAKLYRKILQEQVDIVYIRYTHFANPLFLRFLSRLKRKNIKVLLEIPTYPYDHEYTDVKFKQALFLTIERQARKHFKKYCYRIVTVSNDTEIFGVQTIRISNGIEIESIPVRKIEKEKKDTYRLIGVANVRFWHGYDRLIEGLHDYYARTKNKTRVIFDIIGDSDNRESEVYRKMVQDYQLEDKVFFHGVLNAGELSPYFNRADLAVGSLGIHRIGLQEAKPIKNREYCARGIPFMYAMIDTDFDTKEFALKVPPDDTHIDVNTLINFLENTDFSINSIRQYAVDNLTWNSITAQIIREI